MLVGLGCVCLQLLAAASVLPGSAAAADPISHDRLGVNFTGAPPDLATASAAGVGLARDQVIAGSNTDAVVSLTAAAHLRLYPMLGLPRSQGPAADAAAMATFVTSFAQRYGRGGSFWAAHPELPYLPVESYEIGNEPDITPTTPADSTSLHYADPNAFAQVYQTARAALHQVDPAAQAVVGGMLDSGAIGLDQAEWYLGAIGPMDAVGYHPYLYDVTTMEKDTLALRAVARCQRTRRGAARHQRVRRAGQHRRLGTANRGVHPMGAVHAGAARRERAGVLVGRDPPRRHRPVVLDGQQRAVRDVVRNRLPERGRGPDLAGMSGAVARASGFGNGVLASADRHAEEAQRQGCQGASPQEEDPPPASAQACASAPRNA